MRCIFGKLRNIVKSKVAIGTVGGVVVAASVLNFVVYAIPKVGAQSVVHSATHSRVSAVSSSASSSASTLGSIHHATTVPSVSTKTTLHAIAPLTQSLVEHVSNDTFYTATGKVQSTKSERKSCPCYCGQYSIWVDA